jgi:hypothetical protein
VERILLALVAGALGGAAGAVTVGLVQDRSPATIATPAPTADAPWKDLADRLARIEAALPPLRVDPASGGPSLAGAGEAPSGEAVASAAQEARWQKVEERIAAAVERAVWRAEERGAEKAAAPREERRKRATLAEVGKEIGLSRAEEDELRRIYDDTFQRFLEIVAEPDGDVEAIRRDLESASKSEAGRMVVMKYVPKILPKIGDMMALQAERESRVAVVLGPERVERYRRFDVVEADPYGLSGGFRMEARAR